MSATVPTLDDVLESFLLDSAEPAAVRRYLTAYPDHALDLLDLLHQLQLSPVDDIGALGPIEQAAVERALTKVGDVWPVAAPGERDVFALLGRAAYAELARTLDVPLQVIAAVRNRRAIPSTIPSGFLRRMATALNGSVDDLLFSIGAPRAATSSYKSVDRPTLQEPVPFERILIDARVSDERRLAILADRD